MGEIAFVTIILLKFNQSVVSRALRRRHCVDYGAPVNFGRLRRAAGQNNSDCGGAARRGR